MNKIFYFIIIIIFINSCSFDNKTGIWQGSDQITKKKLKKTESNLELVFKKKEIVIGQKELSLNQKLKLNSPKTFVNWSQSNQNKFNNIDNVKFFNNGKYKKLSKITNAKINNSILGKGDNLFFSDKKGNVGVYSLSSNRLIYKYNFYKKKMKKTNKDIEILLKDESIIVTDNFGYIYSLDYKNNKVNWAKNYLIPFRSNSKIIDNTLFVSDEKNKIILINIKDGKKIDEFYTQPSKTVSSFKSNLAFDEKNNLLFLSTSGTLYSLNLINSKEINWIQNFKPETEIIFRANPIVVSKNNIIISTDKKISLLTSNGEKKWDLNVKSRLLPASSGNMILTVNNDNYLILISKETGEILFSKSIYSMIENYLNKNFKKKIKKINHIYIANSKLVLISDNSYFIEIDLEKFKVSSIKKNTFDIYSDVIFLKNEMIFVDKKKRIYRFN